MKKHSAKINKADWDAVDSPPLADEMLAKMQPVNENHPDIPKRVRGQQKEPVKVPVSIRLDPDVVDYFKSSGKGWHTKINDILSAYVKKQDEE
ncbi:MAG TPA: BrnA antitoxin family protein [bacterium]|nr:BrnA antitoxin family protein [bacterium]HPN44402.1 BrnA antitoxin family protein [bacterium]